MRKLVAISFLGLLLFNLVGYRFLFSLLQEESSIHLEAELDKGDYDTRELITLRVPLFMPYQSDWNEFRRVDGEISFGGQHYRTVMRKVENGQLVLLCLPDHNRVMLENGSNEYAVHSNDLGPASPSKKSAAAFKKTCFTGDYELGFHSSINNPVVARKERDAVFAFSRLAFCFLPFHGKPPEPPHC